MMSDIHGKDVVDRLPMIVSRLGVDQLLCVPKLPRCTKKIWLKYGIIIEECDCNHYVLFIFVYKSNFWKTILRQYFCGRFICR